MNFQDDSSTAFADLDFREAPYPLFVHDDVISSLGTHPPERRGRLRLVLHHLASLGRTSVVKSCSDPVNRGWRRAPLGGGRGMQYYLWWSPKSGPQTTDLTAPLRSIFIRAIRHHDDHSPLSSGSVDDYHSIQTRDVLAPNEDALGPTPITGDQYNFVFDAEPVRVLLGRPGAGKTTALLHAIFSRRRQRVLYVTWSERLCTVAREQAAAFAPKDTFVDAIDFTTLLSRILGYDLDRLPHDYSLGALNALLDGTPASQLGEWSSRPESMLAEVRAYLVGRAETAEIPTSTHSFPLMPSREYVKSRREEIGEPAAKRLTDLITLAERRGSLAKVFPEIYAAHEAIRRLRDGYLPPGFESFQKIAVDEAQDLTSVEISVLIELCKAIRRVHGDQAPAFLIAGDEGQTVRPSGFGVPVLKRLVSSLQVPKEYKLLAPLRYPQEIAKVIDRAQDLYGNLQRRSRPSNQAQVDCGGHVNGQVRHISEPDPELARSMLLELTSKRIDSVIIVSAGAPVPDWVDDALRQEVLLPHEAKGLEYQTVVVLDPGQVLADLSSRIGFEKLRDAELRSAIDRLRVAMTRATETLVFMDVAAAPDVERLSRDLLGQAASLDSETALQSIFGESDVEQGLEDQVQRLVDQSRTLREQRPDSAWRRAYHAMELLGDPGRPQGVAATDIRAAAYREVCDSAIRFLARGVVDDDSIMAAAEKSANGLGDELGKGEELADLLKGILRLLRTFRQGHSFEAMALLSSVAALGQEISWVQEALTAVSERLRVAIDAAAEDRECAHWFKSASAADWLTITGFIGDPAEKIRSLRRTALRTLIDARDVNEARNVLEAHDVVDSEDFELKGRLLELQEKYPEAAGAYQQAGNARAAVAAWRHAAAWEQAALLGEQLPAEEAAQLSWLIDAAHLAEQRPSGLWETLSTAERVRLQRHFPPFDRR